MKHLKIFALIMISLVPKVVLADFTDELKAKYFSSGTGNVEDIKCTYIKDHSKSDDSSNKTKYLMEYEKIVITLASSHNYFNIEIINQGGSSIGKWKFDDDLKWPDTRYEIPIDPKILIVKATAGNILNNTTAYGRCPQNIKLRKRTKGSYWLDIPAETASSAAYYSLDEANSYVKINTQGCNQTYDSSCHNTYATSCKMYTYKAQWGNQHTECAELYIEVGKKVDANCNVSNYLAISNDMAKGWVTGIPDASGNITIDGDFFAKGNNTVSFWLLKESVNDLFSNYVEKSSLGICSSVMAGTNNNYIYKKGGYNPQDHIGKQNQCQTVPETDDCTSVLPVLDPTNPSELSDLSCSSLFGDPANQGDPAYYMTYAFKIMRYVAIVLLAVLSVMDYIEATSSQDSDAINKATNRTIKRLILCVIIFLLPSLIEFILTMLNNRAANLCIDK